MNYKLFTLSKNGRSLKSQMSRIDFLRKTCLALLVGIIFISNTFSQNRAFPDSLVIVTKADFAEDLKSRPTSKKYNYISFDGKKYSCYVNYRSGVRDAVGNWIIPEENQLIIKNGDLFEVHKKGWRELIDRNGKTISSVADELHSQYDYLYTEVSFAHREANVAHREANIAHREYDNAIKMSNQLYRVRKNNKLGVVDIHGNEIIPCLYDIIHEEGALYRVRKDNKWGVLDFSGKTIIPLEYDHLGNFKNDISKVKKNDYFGYIDKNNRVVVDIKYAYINPPVNGVAEACECEQFVQAQNQKMVKQYEKKGYILLKTPTRLMAMCKNPTYSQLKIE